MTVQAAIDVGSNSVKLLVLSIDDAGGYRILHDAARVTGLGRGLGDSGELHPEAVQDTMACLGDFAAKAQELGAGGIRAAGTSALRRATDSEGFTRRVQVEHGISIEIISGEEEARLSRVVALRELPEGTEDVVFFDVGGGSTELTWCRGDDVRGAVSLRLGARHCTEQACIGHPVTPLMRERLKAMIDTALAAAPGPGGAVQLRLAGLGGTATTLVWMLRGLVGEPPGDPHLANISLDAAVGILALLAGRTIRGVRGLPSLDPARAEVIYAGIAIITGLLTHYGAKRFTLVDRGLRFGLLLG